ncbi:MAG TPA: ATP-binding protein [Anaerolineae bacterium]|nr:ATP-binding protein [Anaerolineae bacterium]
MFFELWGANELPNIIWPERTSAYLLLIVYLVPLLYALFYYRNQTSRSIVTRLARRRWPLVVLLAVLAFVAGQVALVSFTPNNQLSPLGLAQNPVVTIAPLGSVPLLMAAALLNPIAAMLVGFSGSLGRVLWQSHQIFDLFHLPLATLLAAAWLQQNYRGRVYTALRQPLVVGTIVYFFILPFIILANFAYTPLVSNLYESVDLALSTTGATLVPLLIEGVAAGLLLSLFFLIAPTWRPRVGRLVPSPSSRSLSRRLLVNFVLVAIPILVILILAVFNLTIYISTQLIINQVAHDADTVAEQIPNYRTYRQNLLMEYSDYTPLRSANEEQVKTALSRIFRTGDLFRRVVLVDAEGEVVAFFPQDVDDVTLTPSEASLLGRALGAGVPSVTTAQTTAEEAHILSFVSPVFNDEREPVGALIGRVPEISLDSLIVGLQGSVGAGRGFIIDENEQVIAHPDKSLLRKLWSTETIQQRLINTDSAYGLAYESRSPETNARELVYIREGSDEHPWTVVITVPYVVITRLALQIGTPLTLVLISAVIAFALTLMTLSRSVTEPIQQLAHATQRIASGSLNIPVNTTGNDEIGQLGQSFEAMQRALRRRLDELSLLVNVSQHVSGSLNMNAGMPAILQGVIRGTGASGVRAVLINPSGNTPIIFYQGPANDRMPAFDRLLMNHVRLQREIFAQNRNEVKRALQLDVTISSPFYSFVAIGLFHRNRYQGLFWLAYTQPHAITATERDVVRTLANQASILVENDRLYTSASSGRRRLAAVLASTADAVIVTDSTDRILLVNPAMEEAFNLKSSDAVGADVRTVIHDDNFLQALTTHTKRVRIEVLSDSKRTFTAHAAPIIASDGQALGRVVVLHDITKLKEIDQMKSEFVSTVSHDLRGPLSFMRGYTTMLPMVGEINNKQEEYINKIITGIDQMTTLVNDLLDLGRIESGMELELGIIRFQNLLRYIATDYEQPAENAGLRLVVEAVDDLSPVQGDIGLIRQAISNLVGNAVKYAPNSGDLILRAVEEDEMVVISINDQGPGIPEEAQKRLFERFYRVKARQNASVKGSGLGLAIVRSIAERHGGDAWYETNEDGGSSFFLKFPFQPPVPTPQNED